MRPYALLLLHRWEDNSPFCRTPKRFRTDIVQVPELDLGPPAVIVDALPEAQAVPADEDEDMGAFDDFLASILSDDHAGPDMG